MDQRADSVDKELRRLNEGEKSESSLSESLERSETEQIEREIERTRQHLGHTIDSIQERLSIRQITAQLVEESSRRAGTLARATWRAIENNPVPTALLSGAAVFLLARRASRSSAKESFLRARVPNSLSRFGRKGRSEVQGRVREMLGRAAEHTNGLSDIDTTVPEAGRSVDGNRAVDRDRENFPRLLAASIQQDPIICGAGAMLLGVALSSLVPKSGSECAFVNFTADLFVNGALGRKDPPHSMTSHLSSQDSRRGDTSIGGSGNARPDTGALVDTGSVSADFSTGGVGMATRPKVNPV